MRRAEAAYSNASLQAVIADERANTAEIEAENARKDASIAQQNAKMAGQSLEGAKASAEEAAATLQELRDAVARGDFKGDKGDPGPAGPSYDDTEVRALITEAEHCLGYETAWIKHGFVGNASNYFAMGGSDGMSIPLKAGTYTIEWQFDQNMPQDATYASYVKIGSADSNRWNKTGRHNTWANITLAEDGTISFWLYASGSRFATYGYPKVNVHVYRGSKVDSNMLMESLMEMSEIVYA